MCCVVAVGDVFCSVLKLFKGCLAMCCVVVVVVELPQAPEDDPQKR